MDQPAGCSNLNPFDAENVSSVMGMYAKFGREHLVFLLGAHIRPGVFDKDLFFHEPHCGASLFEDDEVWSVRLGADLIATYLVIIRAFVKLTLPSISENAYV